MLLSFPTESCNVTKSRYGWEKGTVYLLRCKFIENCLEINHKIASANFKF